MIRVVFYRVGALGRGTASEWAETTARLAARREWRHDPMWLATDASHGLFEMEYLRHARLAAAQPVLGAGFVRIQGDETDALAVLFTLVALTQRFGGRVELRDDENPIRKLRALELVDGVPVGGRSLDELMVAQPLLKRLPGAVITFYPPRYRSVAQDGAPAPAGQWRFGLSGLRAAAPGFLEAEAEAMRMYRSLRAIA